jgi:methyl-accepting chemotaxis protein
VQEITAASEEQSSGVGQINAAIVQLSQTTQQNASSSEELAATAEEMSSQAEQLQQTMSFFKLAGTAHARAAATAIAAAGRQAKAARAAPRRPVKQPARGMTPTFADAGTDDALDEAHFGRF